MSRKGMNKKGRQWIYRIIGIISVAVFLFSAYKLYGYYSEVHESDQVTLFLMEQAVTIHAAEPTQRPSTNAEEPDSFPLETAPISVDFSILQAENPDIIAWLYCADTPINDPVLYSGDNTYYLKRLPNGKRNSAGSLFLDYQNATDFTDWNSIIYGHNMKSDARFGTIDEYRNQEYYDMHPVMYLLTPEQAYKVQLIAGYTTPSDSDAYSIAKATPKERADYIEQVKEKSTFTADVNILPSDRLLTLSTCARDYANARYVLVGVLREIGQYVAAYPNKILI